MANDRELGMDRKITRRDLINGVSMAIVGSVVAPGLATAQQPASALETSPGYYPPALTGMRGSHEGSYEVAHALRDGKRFDAGEDTGESYDLVVVGGGLSGLGSAYYFRKAQPEAKILILENHDDFGGHARRNEFKYGNRKLIGYGGTFHIQAPASYMPSDKALLEEIGIDSRRFFATTKDSTKMYRSMGLGRGVFFDKETFGVNRLVVGEPERRDDKINTWAKFLAKTPLSEPAKNDLLRLYEDRRDYLPGLTKEEKIKQLHKMSYRDYLVNCVKVDPQVLSFLHMRVSSNNANGIDTISAWSAFHANRFGEEVSVQIPGFEGLGLEKPPLSWVKGDEMGEDIHFPDGNATVARLLVRWFNPKALPGSSMEDAVTTPINYAALDETGLPVRMRLNSTVVHARHLGDLSKAREVEVTYVRRGKAERVRAGACVMACYNAVIPYLCPDMPMTQKEALHMAVRKPWIATQIAVRDWKAFHKLGVSSIYCPGSFHQQVGLDYGISIGKYRPSLTPEEPMIVGLTRHPEKPGLPPRDQFRACRAEMLETSFETYERKVRDQLGRALSEGGFDPARDIEAITINRWAHGLATGSNELYDPDWSNEEVPWVVGRKRFGRIAIANSDAAATCLTQAAFDMAHFAVQEIVTDVIRPVYQFPWAERM